MLFLRSELLPHEFEFFLGCDPLGDGCLGEGSGCDGCMGEGSACDGCMGDLRGLIAGNLMGDDRDVCGEGCEGCVCGVRTEDLVGDDIGEGCV